MAAAVKKIKVSPYKIRFQDWAASNFEDPPGDNYRIRGFWQVIDQVDEDKLVYDFIGEMIQDVRDVLDGEHERMHVHHVSIEDAEVRADARVSQLCHREELRVYFEIVTVR